MSGSRESAANDLTPARAAAPLGVADKPARTAGERSKRWLLGISMGAALITLVILDYPQQTPWACLVLILGLGLATHREFLNLSEPPLPRWLRWIAQGFAGLAIATPMAFVWLGGPVGFLAALAAEGFLLLFATTLAWLCTRWRKPVEAADFSRLGWVFFGHTAFALPFAMMAASARLSNGVLFTFAIVASSKFNDIGAYFFGSRFGKTPLIPGVSPKKTIEGAFGGLFVGIVAFVLLSSLIGRLSGALSWPERLALAVLVAPLAQIGDLFASAVKRTFQRKDSSRLVPGFGGLIDVLDSLIFTVPLGFALGLLWL